MARKTLLTKLDEFPPFLVFALVRRQGKQRKRPHYLDIVKQSGLPERTFLRVARKISWGGVKVATVDAFMQACQFDITRVYEHRGYLKRRAQQYEPNPKRPQERKGKFRHLSPQQMKTFNTCALKWLEAKDRATSLAPSNRS